MLDRIRHDLRLAARTLIRSPGVFAIAVLSLAIGIGANTTIFSAVDVFLLRLLPYPEAERIVRVWRTDSERVWTEAGLSAPDFQGSVARAARSTWRCTRARASTCRAARSRSG